MKQMNLLYFSLAQGVSRLSSCITEPNTRGSTSQLIRKRDPLHISAFFYSPPQHTAKCRPSNCPSDALSWSGGPQIIWVSTTFDLAQNLRLKRSWLLQVFLPHTKLLVNILHVCPTSLQIRSWVDTAEAITALCKVRHQVIHVENNLRARKKEEEKMGGKLYIVALTMSNVSKLVWLYQVLARGGDGSRVEQYDQDICLQCYQREHCLCLRLLSSSLKH